MQVHPGEWMNRLTSDTVTVAEGLTQILPGVTGLMVRILGAGGMLLSLYPAFGWILIPGGLLLIFMSYAFRRGLKNLHKQVQEADGSFRVFVQECLTGMLAVRAFVREKEMVIHAREKMEEHKKKRMERNHFSNFCNVGFSLAMNGAYVLGAAVGGYGILKGTMTYGTMMAIVQLIAQIQSPVANITGYLPQYYGMLASAERLREVESYPCEKMLPLSLDEVQEFYANDLRAIVLKDAGFTYLPPAKEKMEMPIVFEHIDLEVPKGFCVALTGSSGCGKSTVLKLLMCLYHLDHGERILAGRDGKVQELTSAWRRLFAYVPQGNQLMSGTVRQVVAFGNTEAMKDHRRLKQSLEAADALKFVRELPQGMDTFLGAEGTGLSEGQLQRLAIARALFSGNPVLILDEATSALDEETEKVVLNNIHAMTDKTVLIVTHRKAVLDVCDGEIQFSPEGIRLKTLEGSGNERVQSGGEDESSITG